jgi:pSer/pThr/pTyr-binding forkhead associated (FHA) protein
LKSPLIFRIFKNSQLQGVKQFDLAQVVIGHKAEVNLDLESEEVSPIHCLVELREDGYYICDLGSQSGTFKNGQAVLDEMIFTGDEIGVGPYKIGFFVGVPKPKAPPSTGDEARISKAEQSEPFKDLSDTSAAMPPASVAKKQEIGSVAPIPSQKLNSDGKPVIPKGAIRPDIRRENSPSKKDKRAKTFAPLSEITDLKTYLKLTKGSTVEVVVAWKERVLNTYHFQGQQLVRVNVDSDQHVHLPDGLVPRGYPLFDMKGGLKVQSTPDMEIELVTASGVQRFEELSQNGKTKKSGSGFLTKVEQHEMLCVTMPGGNINLYFRNVPTAPVVPLAPLLISGSEFAGLLMSFLLVGLLALYISATTPKDWEQDKQEDLQRIAQVVFNKPPVPMTKVSPTPEPTPTPTPTPTPEPKKVAVEEKTQEAQEKAGGKPAKMASTQKKARANEVAPKPSAQDRTKKFTSVRQGGAVKMGDTQGANAKSPKKDMSKVGLFSAFGGGGTRANIDKAYSGAGEVLGMADKATGSTGFNENRAGSDLGSKFKDSGAGGKGTATQGIAGIGTKGRSSGQSAYGASDGLGGKSNVAIEGGGMEEAFDGTIDKEAIRRVIRAKIYEIKSCYERALNRQEKGKRLEGKIVLGWEIIEKGEARNVKVKSSTLGNPQVENCIRDRLASWTFPEPPPGLIAEVQAYPFVLNQAN